MNWGAAMIRQLWCGLGLLLLLSSATHAQFRPEKYGVKVGEGQSPEVRLANHAAMKSCLDAAINAGGSVLLPAATIEIDVPNNGSTASSTLKINRSVKIIGTDRRLSRLKFGPESPPYGYSGFYVGPNTFVTFKDCTIEGPSDPGPNEKFNRQTHAIMQTGMSYASGQKIYNTPGELRLENVAIAGEWYTSITGAHGDAALVIIDSDITGYTQCIAWSANFNMGKTLYARNTYFHDAGLPQKGHLLYLSPNVSFEIDNCRFGGNFRYAIHHYGSAQTPPKFARLLNSKFESTLADGIETTGTGVTQIKNCIFETKRRAVALKGDTNIEDSTFNNGTIVTTYDRHSGVRISIVRSKFNGGGINTSVWQDCIWKISDSEFTGTGFGSNGIGSGAAGTVIEIDNSRFKGTFRRGISAAGGTFNVRNCNFDGTYREAAIIYDDTSGNVTQLSVTNNTFNTTGRSIWAMSGASGKVVGQSNFFHSNQPIARSGMYQGLELRNAASPENLTSSASLTPSFNYDTYRVTGGSIINDIKLGGRDEVNQMCAGKLKLIVDGRWSLGSNGNIKPLTAETRKPGSVVTLVRDPQAGLWVEVTN
jgi:hypothetical protein